MAIYSLAGAKVSIGSARSTKPASVADFTDTYTQIGETETLSDFGDTAADVPFTGLTDGRTQHLKGTLDGGTADITCGRDDADAGQAAVRAALASPLDYNFKIEWNNAATAGGTGGITYFSGKVMATPLVNGTGPNNVMKRKFTIGVNSAQYDVAPT